MRIKILYLATLLIVTITACKKGPGEGGQTSIVGKVWEEKYILSFHDSTKDRWASEQDVYIIYGDEVSYGNRTRTGPDGVFEFKYLRKGSYSIYVYSDVSTSSKEAIIKQIDIPKSGTADIGTYTIKKISN